MATGCGIMRGDARCPCPLDRERVLDAIAVASGAQAARESKRGATPGIHVEVPDPPEPTPEPRHHSLPTRERRRPVT